MGAQYDDLETFYYARPSRRESPEWDYGVHWRDEHGSYRVTWASTPGELYAVRLAPARIAAGAGILTWAAGGSGGSVEVLADIAAIAPEHETLKWRGDRHVNDVVLGGWASASPDFQWVSQRAAAARAHLQRRRRRSLHTDASGTYALLGELDRHRQQLERVGVEQRAWEVVSQTSLLDGGSEVLPAQLFVVLPEDQAAAQAAREIFDAAIATVGLQADGWESAPGLAARGG